LFGICEAESFFDSDRAAVLNIKPLDVILVKENIVQLPHIDHFATPAALVKVPFLRFTQFVKVSGIHLNVCRNRR
jgi:hypothetical protein